MLCLVHHLSNHYAAIARREDKLVVVNLNAARLTKEGSHKEPKDKQEDGHKPNISCDAVDAEKADKPYSQADKSRETDYLITLFINLHTVLGFG